MKFTLYTARVCGESKNTVYPEKAVVSGKEELARATSRDYVCAEYRDGRRANKNFLSSDCLAVDCDNTHTEDEALWLTPRNIVSSFPDVCFAVHYSRNHMREKNGAKARPRFHVFFPIPRQKDAARYAELKQRLVRCLPGLDNGAKDSARFFFGTQPSETEWHEGALSVLDAWEQEDEFAAMSDKGVIREGSRNNRLHTYAVKYLTRFGDTQKARVMYRNLADRCEPPLDNEELKNIWTSARRYYHKTIEADPNYCRPEDYGIPEEADWDDPIPLEQMDIPAFPVDALPKPIADYVEALAESTQTPPDMAASTAIAVMSVCMQGKYVIQGKADWIEPVNTYVLCVMEPSERKSTVERAMTRPLNLYAKHQKAASAAAVEESKIRWNIIESKAKKLVAKATRGKVTDEEISELAREQAEFKAATRPAMFVDDITPEKLLSVMAENNGRAAIISSEGGIFDILAGTYSKSVNIDVFLKAYSGDSARSDRIGRASEDIEHATLTMLLMAQPSVLEGLMQNQVFKGRGLTARFLYCVPRSRVGTRVFDSTPVPHGVYEAYERCIKNMAEDEDREEPVIIPLTQAARRMLAEFSDRLEAGLVDEHSEVVDWAAKLVGNTLRISALLCRASACNSHDFMAPGEELCVDEETMGNAIRIGEYFLDHAHAAYGLMGIESKADRCRKVLETLQKKHVKSFTRRDIMRMCRTLRKADEVQTIINLLYEYGYIAPKPTEEKKASTGRPQNQVWLVSPKAFMYLGKKGRQN